MPFSFTLPTTSAFSFSSSFESPSHPSLPLSASTYRGVLRDSLKKHKRLPPSSQSTNLPYLLQSIEAYTPYLLALDTGLCSKSLSGEEIDVVLGPTPNLEWRPILSATTIPGREPPRLKFQSLEYEIVFVLSTLANTYTLLSRASLQPLYSTSSHSPSTEFRTTAIQTAMKSLLLAASIHAHTASRLSTVTSFSPPPDLSQSSHTALSSLAHAEATLLAVLKDDPYTSAIAQEHNKNDNEWMIKAPSIPKVRAMLFARLCLGSAEHAAKAGALLRGVGKVDESLLGYVEDLRIVGRAKACRFFGVDAELGGEQGVALAWLKAAKSILQISSSTSSTKPSGSKFSLSRMKKDIQEKREEKKVEVSGNWGSDAGRGEEGRVVEYLERKWMKVNDTVNTQRIPPEGPLLASMPTGRDFTTINTWTEPQLDSSTLMSLRAPPTRDERDVLGEDDSEEEDGSGGVVGAFPGTKNQYAGSGGYF